MLSVGGTYTILSEFDSYANLGLNVAAQIGPVQAFATTDNIVAAFQPGDAHTFSARVGVNLLLGNSKTADSN